MALLFLNRMDYALILFPILVYLLMHYKSKNRTPFAVATLIVSGWLLFSLFYFGHLFPNTYYAKLQAGYPLQDYLQRGFQYFKVQLLADPITLVIISTGIVLGLFRKGITRAVAIGLILYLLYFFKSGGDYAGTLFCCTCLCCNFFDCLFFIQDRDLKIYLFTGSSCYTVWRKRYFPSLCRKRV